MRMSSKKISSDLGLFYYDPEPPDEPCFVLKDELYGDEITLTSKEMETLIDSVMKMKTEVLSLTSTQLEKGSK